MSVFRRRRHQQSKSSSQFICEIDADLRLVDFSSSGALLPDVAALGAKHNPVLMKDVPFARPAAVAAAADAAGAGASSSSSTAAAANETKKNEEENNIVIAAIEAVIAAVPGRSVSFAEWCNTATTEVLSPSPAVESSATATTSSPSSSAPAVLSTHDVQLFDDSVIEFRLGLHQLKDDLEALCEVAKKM